MPKNNERPRYLGDVLRGRKVLVEEMWNSGGLRVDFVRGVLPDDEKFDVEFFTNGNSEWSYPNGSLDSINENLLSFVFRMINMQAEIRIYPYDDNPSVYQGVFDDMRNNLDRFLLLFWNQEIGIGNKPVEMGLRIKKMKDIFR